MGFGFGVRTGLRFGVHPRLGLGTRPRFGLHLGFDFGFRFRFGFGACLGLRFCPGFGFDRRTHVRLGFGACLGFGRGLDLAFCAHARLRGGDRRLFGLGFGCGLDSCLGFRQHARFRFRFLARPGFSSRKRRSRGARFGFRFRLGACFGLAAELRHRLWQSEVEIGIARRGWLPGFRWFVKDLDVAVGEQLFECRQQRAFFHARFLRQIRQPGLAIHCQKHQAERPRQADGPVLDLEYAFGSLAK